MRKPGPNLRFAHQDSRRLLCYGLLICLYVSAPVFADWEVSDADGELRIGPLMAGSELNDITADLDRESIGYHINDITSRESLGFIVVSPLYDGKESAALDLSRLSEAGIKDYLYVARGDYANRISVGVFSDQDSAQSRTDTVNAFDFGFDVIERFKIRYTKELVLETPDLTSDSLSAVLAGGPLPPPESKDIQSVAPPVALDDGEINVVPTEVPPVIEIAKTEEVPVQKQVAVEEKIPPTKSSSPVVRSMQKSDDTWLWILFVGLIVVIAGALAYLYLQRRQYAATAKQTTVVDPSPEPAPTTVSEELSPAEVIAEYAESVLAGRSDDSVNNNLTILGTEDTAVADLIQDLLFLTRLEEQQATLESFVFDIRSLVDGLIARLSVTTSVPIKSEPDDSLPQSLSMDAGKLARILTILLRYATSRTESGLITIIQTYKDSQLALSIRFHPTGGDLDQEINAITNPASSNSELDISNRVSFGVANRLAIVLGGRIDTRLEAGEATITVRSPAMEVQKAQLVLPTGQTIDDLLEAEARAGEQIEAARHEAEVRIQDSEARAQRIERESAASIQELQERLQTASQSSHKHLSEREQAINNLQSQITQLEQEREQSLNLEQQEKAAAVLQLENLTAELGAARDQLHQEVSARTVAEQRAEEQEHLIEREKRSSEEKLETERREKAEAVARLDKLTRELTTARDQLQEEAAARTTAEKQAQDKVNQLEQTLSQTNDAVKGEKAELQLNVDNASNEVNSLTGQLAELKSRLEGGTLEAKQEIDQLRRRLQEATSRLDQEILLRTESSSDTERQVKKLLEQLNEARGVADEASTERSTSTLQLQAANE
ncbi:MAG: hypothetical protein HOE54_04310, partial [Gammaproteobacteria bacterium]|nr:hypothetical protein [Gammaproteobacteria bacterium]